MPGRHHTPAFVVPGPASSRREAARVVLPRVAAVALLVAAVGAIAGFAGYTGGRRSVDRDALRSQAYEAGRAAGVHSSGAHADASSGRLGAGGGVAARPRTAVRRVASRAEV